MSKTLPPLTPDEFNAGAPEVHNGIPLVENEYGSAVYAYGHIGQAAFARAVTEFDRSMGADMPTLPLEVRHVWAVTERAADDPDGWWIRWGGVVEGDPNAFALTVVQR